jgi:hypothetical protein
MLVFVQRWDRPGFSPIRRSGRRGLRAPFLLVLRRLGCGEDRRMPSDVSLGNQRPAAVRGRSGATIPGVQVARRRGPFRFFFWSRSQPDSEPVSLPSPRPQKGKARASKNRRAVAAGGGWEHEANSGALAVVAAKADSEGARRRPGRGCSGDWGEGRHHKHISRSNKQLYCQNSESPVLEPPGWSSMLNSTRIFNRLGIFLAS